MSTETQTIIARAARLSALAALAAGSPEDLEDVAGGPASDGEHDALDRDMRAAHARLADRDEHDAFAKAYRSEVVECLRDAEVAACGHLEAPPAWRSAEGLSDKALGLDGDEAWGGVPESDWASLDQGAWSRLCRLAVRREARSRAVTESMTTYTADDGTGGEETFEAVDFDGAWEQALEWVREGDWGQESGTTWVRLTVTNGAGDERSKTVAIDPPEADCAEGHEHDWVSPYWLLGGLEENPGVQGHGGGVIVTEACRHCGAKKVTDSWAQNPETGEQGLNSVKYEEGFFSDDFAERGTKAADEAELQTEEEAKAAVDEKGLLYRDAYLARMAERREETETEARP